MKTIVTNIQRFCLHDGPGIRTTLFFKGCSIHCPWCANPENINNNIQYYFDEKKCIKKSNNCILNDKCCAITNDISEKNLIECDSKCLMDAIKCYGEEVDSNYLLTESMKDIDFYKNNGGITLSGGEPLLFINNIKDFLEEIKDNNINIAVETSLFVNSEQLEESIKYVNYYIVDFKIFNKEKCKEILGGNIDLFLDNLNKLSSKVDKNNILIRIPIIKGYTNDIDNISKISDYISQLCLKKVQIFSGHSLAEQKYKSLNKQVLKNVDVSQKELNEIKECIEKRNIEVEVIKL